METLTAENKRLLGGPNSEEDREEEIIIEEPAAQKMEEIDEMVGKEEELRR